MIEMKNSPLEQKELIMNRGEILLSILEVLNLDEEWVDENTSLDLIEFDSIAKLGVISVIDTCLDKIIDAAQLNDCKKISDLVDLALKEAV